MTTRARLSLAAKQGKGVVAGRGEPGREKLKSQSIRSLKAASARSAGRQQEVGKLRGCWSPALSGCAFREGRWLGAEPRAGWFGALAVSLAARSALLSDGGAARTKCGGWFFASPGTAHTRTHQWGEMERKKEGEQGRATGGEGRGKRKGRES